MSPPVIYRPAYIGLFASLVLSLTTNIYLDIQYGGFGVEVLVWSLIYFFTLRVAWRQGGQVNQTGRDRQKAWVIAAAVLTVLLFIPMWGLPRGGLYALAALQAALNCVTVDRRRFMMGLMVSVVMVIFASMHYRADWTMLFYLVPYLFAVVFTLVAEQVSRRVREVQQDGLGQSMAGGQGASIAAATATLLAVALLLFAATPQVTWLSLKWKYGQLSNIGILHASKQGADGGALERGGAGGNAEESKRSAGADGNDPGGDQDFAGGAAGQSLGQGYRESLGRPSEWPTPKEMREAAKRPGMPVWQASAITQLAGSVEQIQKVLQPLQVKLQAMARLTVEWLEMNLRSVLRGLMVFMLLLLLGAGYVLLRELRLGLWLRMQADFLRFGLLGFHAPGNAGARQYFAAMERLFVMNHAEREKRQNAREYLAVLHQMHRPLRGEASEMTGLFEQARYGNSSVGDGDVARMRQLYRRMYAGV
ncbi:MAG: DUF4129 domain-containing protein [Sulfuritalea sp.]|nr:DUF4129 domain-containing protein [Sulfuritalea sp.]MDP1984094.1 DUF4129 domain-containing protein [Sulfuritalea sp.]